MGIDAIFGSSQTNTTTKTEANNKPQEKEETSLWESFCNEVIAPAIEDSVNSYVDDNFGTNLAEQKKQREEQAELEEALKKEEEQKNKSLTETVDGIIAECVDDALRGYLDDNCGTNLKEAKIQEQKKEQETLDKAHKMQEEKEAQEAKNAQETIGILAKIFKSIFGKN